MKFVPKDPIVNNLALVEIKTWRRISDKPLSEPMLTRITDAYMRHEGEMSQRFDTLSELRDKIV